MARGMSRTGADYAIIATGVGLWYVGAKTIADYHENVSAGVHDDFQHRYGTTIGTGLTLGGMGLAIWGTYRLNPTWGKYLGGGLGALLVFNAVRRKAGEPLLSFAPFPMPKRHLAGWS